jgi:hypothetical protein
LYKGATVEALNAITGQLIWQISGYTSEWAYSGSEWATADGFVTYMNGYDNNIYCLGQGPSITSIQAPLNGFSRQQNNHLRLSNGYLCRHTTSHCES